MEAVTGRDIVANMMRLGTDMARWNKEYATKERVVKRMEELGLTHHQLEILGFLHANPELDTVSALSAELYISKGSLSLMLSKLQAGGFVQKKAARSGDDGRKVYVSLTAKGESAVKEIMNLLIENAAVVFDRMNEERRTLIYTKVKELMELFNVGGWKE
ncbi:MAG: MarR family winged helix-turn-helix transcriptional regulator [Anaerotignum sp.]